MKFLNQVIICLVVIVLSFQSELLAQNSGSNRSEASKSVHFGQMDSRFLWGASGNIVLPYGTPQSMMPNVKMRAGYAFGLDFRHRIGYQGLSDYFVFIHYGVRIGSFFYKTSTDGINLNGNNSSNIEYKDDILFMSNYHPKFIHLDLPIGVELPIYYLLNGRISFNLNTEITSRFYFYSPNRIYNIAGTIGLGARFEKFQIQASYSYFFIPQYSSKSTVSTHINWKISEINVGMKYYF